VWPQGRPDLAFDGGGKVLRPEIALRSATRRLRRLDLQEPDEQLLLLDRHDVQHAEASCRQVAKGHGIDMRQIIERPTSAAAPPSERSIMKFSLIAATALAALLSASPVVASPPGTQPAPRATTLKLDSFTLLPGVTYASNNFWCEYHNYGLYFPNYTGQCPLQNFVATMHWKKVPNVTEYDVCEDVVALSDPDHSRGANCWVIKPPPMSGSAASLSMMFDSTTEYLNTAQGTTHLWWVHACNYVWIDGSIPYGPCTDSNIVTAEIPWTG
jgi:hypothetical protein